MMGSNNKKWDVRFLRLCQLEISQWSKDPSTKVGALVVSPDRSVFSGGYNGYPRGLDDGDYLDRDTKLMKVQHAEVNALRTLGYRDTGWTLYCTHHPCPQCTGAAIQHGIARIVYLIQDDFEKRYDTQLTVSTAMLVQAHIHVTGYSWEDILESSGS